MQKILLLFTCFLLFSCSEKKALVIPDSVLSKQKMAEVLLDIHLLESTITVNNTNPDKGSKNNPTPNFDVLKKNNISKKQYDESFTFYSQHPELLTELYDIILNELSKMQAQVVNKK